MISLTRETHPAPIAQEKRRCRCGTPTNERKNPMPSNLELNELEQRVLDYVKRHPGQDIKQIIWNCANASLNQAEVRQALAQLIALGFVSADENLRYSAVGKEL